MMNREIKFRCYWKGVNKMKHFVMGNFEDTKKNGYVMAFVQKDSDGSIYLGNAEVMQYTGLKDKNGTEVYEGDILHHPLNERWFDWLIEIIDGSTKLINIGIDGYRHDPMLLTQQSASGRIIIGNIYENPELLK